PQPMSVSGRDSVLHGAAPSSRRDAVPARDNPGVKRARPPPVQVPKGRTGGRSGLHRAAQQLTAVHREVRIRATETSRTPGRIAQAMSGDRVKRAISARSNTE